MAANDSLVRMFGHTREELIGRSVVNLYVNHDDLRRCTSEINKKGSVKEYPVRLRRRDGTEIDIVHTTTVTRGKGGEVLGYRGIVRDITETKKAEEALRESEERFRLLIEAAPIGVALVRQGRHVYVNSELVDVFGYDDPKEIQGLPVDALFVPEEKESIARSVLDRVAPRPVPARHESKGVKKDGTTFDVDIWATQINYQGGLAALVFISDITEAKSLRDQLFSVVFESAPDLIFTKDRERRFTMVNPAMERLHGRSASEMIGKQEEDLMSQSAAKRIRKVDLRVLKGETIEEEFMNDIRGNSMHFHGIRVPLRKASGEVFGICGIVRNSTERLQVHRSLGKRVEIDYPSKSMREALTLARRATIADGNVLLLGESGCGKDHLARWIHDHSGRSRGPYFAINCAAVAKELADSELFGHERGAFTGAGEAKKGLLQLAEGGTLLLNEVGELSISLQAKLLTFLDTKSFLRVGGQEHVHVDARIIAATHRDLHDEVQKGTFLAALFYRLNVFTIVVPLFRDRPEDIPLLAREIISRLTAEMQLYEPPPLDPEALNILTRYDWPGNVRELRNVLERALMLWEGGLLNLNVPIPQSGDALWSHRLYFPSDDSLHTLTDEFRREFCLEALRRSDGAKHEAARLLKISRGALYRYLNRGRSPRENGT